MFQKTKNILSIILPIIIIAVFMIGIIVYAWVEPNLAPPGNNVSAPINVSGNDQTFIDSKTLKIKNDSTGLLNIEGALGVQQLFSTAQITNLATGSGYVSIGSGTATPNQERLRLIGNNQVYLGFYPQGASTRYGYIGYSGVGQTTLTVNNQRAGGRLDFGTTNDANSNATRLTISKEGLVGISTTNPEASLDIRGVTNISSNPRVANVGGIYIQSDNTNTSPAIILSATGIFGGNTGGALYLGNVRTAGHGATTAQPGDSVIGSTKRPGDTGSLGYQPAKIIFATGAAGDPEPQIARMAITSIRSINLNDMVTGIGINTTQPEATLDIRNVKSASGNAKVEGVGGIYVTSNVSDNTSAGMVFSVGGTQSYGSVYLGHIRNTGDGGQNVKIGDSVIGTRGGTEHGIGRLVFVTGTPGIGNPGDPNYNPTQPQTIKMVINPNGNILVTQNDLAIISNGGLILKSPNGNCHRIKIQNDKTFTIGDATCPTY